MITFTLDDKELEVEEGKSVLGVAIEQGIDIPTLCYHKELSPYGACRLCLVEIASGPRPRLEASCLYKVTEGLVVKTDTGRVRRARNIMFELLLARCPDSEPIRELAARWGVTAARFRLKETENCMLCGLCVRVCAEVSERHAVSFAGRGAKKTVQTPFDKTSTTCIGCGACAYVCPTKTIAIEQEE